MRSISASKREYQQRKPTVWPVLRHRTLHKNSRRIKVVMQCTAFLLVRTPRCVQPVCHRLDGILERLPIPAA
jgi:hypothetical protein